MIEYKPEAVEDAILRLEGISGNWIEQFHVGPNGDWPAPRLRQLVALAESGFFRVIRLMDRRSGRDILYFRDANMAQLVTLERRCGSGAV